MGFALIDQQVGSKGTIENGVRGELVEVWEFFADNLNETTETLRASGLLPVPYTSRNEQNPSLICMPIEIEQDGEHPSRFIVTIKWSSEPVSDDKKQDSDDPFDWAPKISIRSVREKEVRHFDRKGKPKINSAGDLFDPPIESNVTYLQISIEKNVPFMPDWAFEFVDSVNSSDFDIGDRTILAKCACLEELEVGPIQYSGETAYCVAHLLISVKRPREMRYDEFGASLEFNEEGERVDYVPGPWQTEQLNEGLHAFDGPFSGDRIRIMVLDEDGKKQTAAAPVLLLENGTVLPDPGPLTATYRVFDDHDYADFNDISFLWGT